MDSKPEIVIEVDRLLSAARQQGLQIRLIGGLAVHLQSAKSQGAFVREYPDIDFVVAKQDRSQLGVFFQRLGYIADKQFNLLNGGHRQIYYDQRSGRRVDIFVGDFEMSHKLPMEDRLALDPVTVPLAELLLSKTQIVELNRKDALDIVSLLLNNDLGRDDDKKINLHRIARLCLRYWGLYKTTSINLKRVDEMLRNEDLGLNSTDRQTVLQRVRHIQRTLKAVAKPLFWHIRNQVGTRLRWYTEVEEVDR